MFFFEIIVQDRFGSEKRIKFKRIIHITIRPSSLTHTNINNYFDYPNNTPSVSYYQIFSIKSIFIIYQISINDRTQNSATVTNSSLQSSKSRTSSTNINRIYPQVTIYKTISNYEIIF